MKRIIIISLLFSIAILKAAASQVHTLEQMSMQEKQEMVASLFMGFNGSLASQSDLQRLATLMMVQQETQDSAATNALNTQATEGKLALAGCDQFFDIYRTIVEQNSRLERVHTAAQLDVSKEYHTARTTGEYMYYYDAKLQKEALYAQLCDLSREMIQRDALNNTTETQMTIRRLEYHHMLHARLKVPVMSKDNFKQLYIEVCLKRPTAKRIVQQKRCVASIRQYYPEEPIPATEMAALIKTYQAAYIKACSEYIHNNETSSPLISTETPDAFQKFLSEDIACEQDEKIAGASNDTHDINAIN